MPPTPHLTTSTSPVVLPRHATLRARCAFCGAKSVTVAKRQQFAYDPGPSIKSSVVGALVNPVVAAMERRLIGELSFQLCAPCAREEERATVARSVLQVVAFLLVLAVATTYFNGLTWVAVAVAAAGMILVVEIWRRWLRGVGHITVVRMDGSTMTLRGIHPAAHPRRK